MLQTDGSTLFRRQKTLPAPGEQKVGGSVPLSWFLDAWRLATWSLLMRLLDLNAVIGIADQASLQPKQHADHENYSLLCSREISRKNADDRARPTDNTHIKPPKDPVVNSHAEVHKTLLPHV